MEKKQRKFRIEWFWGLTGCLGFLGLILNEPLYYGFFTFFMFFLGPVIPVKKRK